MVMSDLHLGHKNIVKYRPGFATAIDHDNAIVTNMHALLNKRDVLFILGDAAFSEEGLERIANVNVAKKILILGNHDTERNHISKLVSVFDEIHSLLSYKGVWLTHAPIHPDELRRKLCVHGHTHSHVLSDSRYANVCVEHTNYGPVDLLQVIEQLKAKNPIVTPVK